MKIGILVFPGSNCDHDCYRAIQKITPHEPVYLWHKNTSLEDCEAVIVPGGFSYGDYLRCGAIARYSPLMQTLVEKAKKGLPVLGICNGFQILTEAGLLPGTLMRNQSLKFICKPTWIQLQNDQTIFTKQGEKGKNYQIPIAHMEGNYFIDEEGLKALQDHDQIVFRYVDENGEATLEANPNGSVFNIAGICNQQGNVVGLMPHPERVVEEVLGGTDGRFMFQGI